MLDPITTPSWSLEDAAHLLNRAGFGAAPAPLREWHALGRAAAVEKLLADAAAPPPVPRPDWFTPDQHRDLMIAQRDLKMAAGGDARPDGAARKKLARSIAQIRQHALSATDWWLRCMVETTAPLAEKMTLFWHGHFATSLDKVKDPYLLLQQNELFRQQAVGNLRALTKAVSRDPAMMIYLDTDQSLRTKPNENFAREVMELFTLGEGHYTEQDIREAARAFTGYRVNRLLGRFFFHEPSWDDGEKSFFGTTGRLRGDDIIDLIFARPECSIFLAEKMWRFFVSDDPSPAQIVSLAEVLRGADFELRPVLRTLFLSGEFYAPPHRRAQIKSPVQFLVQAHHTLGVDRLPAVVEVGILQQLGQVIFRPPNVAGWEGGRAWINTTTLLARYNTAGFLIKGPAGGYATPVAQGKNALRRNAAARERVAARQGRPVGADLSTLVPPERRQDRAGVINDLSWRLFQTELPAAECAPFEEFVDQLPAGPLTDAAVGNLLQLMTSTPQYQLC